MLSLPARSLSSIENGREGEETLTAYDAAMDIQQTYRGMMVALPLEEWRRFRTRSPKELAEELRAMARAIDMPRYRKSKQGPKKRPKRGAYRNGGHVSTHRLLKARKKLIKAEK